MLGPAAGHIVQRPPELDKDPEHTHTLMMTTQMVRKSTAGFASQKTLENELISK